ncbi:hypothetical protein RHMOL_Rhmol11G0160500 [Rhododendron molle]|uniref:Uncharacterized protein n=3 Tax=Rhododendron molle TaxID=49168 RepID=A0ACC0LTU7_RHOML|nr:hypothetical protein RHMOL_Rhmol11G0160500 [Rhododendron molle]KAI8531758.1 hypothetical protein RHMOL_Rhmol11G0160500 [Rhododendron molle]KAI8531759.1 hypothetical protein RHMOL_Rhmol11G0160500 [Rhododendron molle]
MALLLFLLIISYHLNVLLQEKRDDCLDGLESMHMRFAGVGKRPTWQGTSLNEYVPKINGLSKDYNTRLPVNGSSRGKKMEGR